MTTPVTAPAPDPRAAARAAVRARWSKRQDEQAVRQAAQAEERAIRQEARRLRQEERADRAAGAAGTAQGWVRRAAPVVGAAVPVALVNATAFIGQFAWVQQHVPWILPGQLLFAVALESVAIYLAWHAHLAQLANDSAGRLKLSAYLFALVIGAMNYSHYARDWHPNALAVGLGLMSALSPWLWGVYSRRASRDKLMERGLVEEHAVRLGANRWMWHPWRAMQVMYHATWVGEGSPQRAIALYEARQTARRSDRASRNGAPAVAQPARQEAIESGAPLAQEGGAPALSAPVPVGADEQGCAIHAAAPLGPSQMIPGTELNGFPVRAIASLSARPTMKSSHEITDERVAEVELRLAGLRADNLPSERDVAKMLCTEHDHRRQAKPLITARKAAGVDVPAFAPRSRPANGAPVNIATPVATMPGGATANG
jgi:hypothetical protein